MLDNSAIVYKDPALLAIDKPAGILVHSDGTGARSLTDEVRALLGDEAKEAQAVQRLDVETTGIVLFSLSKAVQPALDAAIASGAVRKRYLALLAGSLGGEERVVEAAIGRDRHDARRMRVSNTGKPAVTIVRPIARFGNATLAEVELMTGRRHQIRVHMASIGHPVVGDALYQGPACKDGLMLHALEERLMHPQTAELLVLKTAWPKRFNDFRAPRGHEWSILD